MSDTKKGYKGPNPFTQDDADIFCGRDKEIGIIINNLLVERLTILYGESGVGKSSILQAGVAPIFINKDKDSETYKKYGIPGNCAITVFSLRQNNDQGQNNDPLQWLKEKIKQDLKIFQHIEFSEPQDSFVDTLQAWTEELGGKEKDGELFIILDQFEDYFLLPQINGKGSFILEFSRAVNRDNLPVNFLISIREDSFAKLDCFRGRINNLFDNLLHLQYLNGKAARDAIIKPIEKYNKNNQIEYQIGQDEEKEQEKEQEQLVTAVLEQVQAGKIFQDKSNILIGDDSQAEFLENTFIETSYLQIVMEWFWDNAEPDEHGKYILSLKELEKLEEEDIGKGIKKIVREYLNDKIEKLLDLDEEKKDKQKRRIAYIFYHLITPGGTKLSLTIDDFIEYSQESFFKVLEGEDINNLLNKLNDCRILQIDNDQRYRIRQDTLIPAINYWREQYLQVARDIAIEKGLPAQSLRQLRRGRHDLAALLALEAYKFNKQDNLDMLDEVDDALAQSLSVDYFSQIFRVHTDSVSTVAFSPDSKILASASHDCSIVHYNLCSNNSENNGNRIKDAHEDKILAIAFVPEKNSKILVSASQDGTVKLWNLDEESLQNTSKKKILCKHTYTNKEKKVLPWHITSLAFSQDGSMLAIGSVHGTIILFKLKNSKSLLTLDDCDDGQLLKVYATQSGTISLNPSWKDICKPQIYILQNKGEEEGRKVRSLAFRPKGKEGNWLAAGYNNGTVRLWDLNQTATKLACDIQEIKSYESLRPKIKDKNKNATTVALNKPVKGLAFNRDGNILAFGVEDCEIWLCHVDKLPDKYKSQRLYERLGKNEDLGEINSLAFHPKKDKDNILASAGEDQKVRLWDVSQPTKKTERLPGQYFGISSVAFSSDGKWLATGSWNHRVRLWNLELPPKAKPLILNNTQINESDKTKLQESSILKENLYATHLGNVMFVAVIPEGNMIASASWDRTVGLWERNSSDGKFEFRKLPEVHQERVWSVAFSQDGKLLVSSGANNNKVVTRYGTARFEIEDNIVRLWNLEDIKNSERVIRSIVFPERLNFKNVPIKFLLLLLKINYLVGILFLHNLKVAKDGFSSVAFSPNGKILATGLWDDRYQGHSTILLWDIRNRNNFDWQKGKLSKERPIFLKHHESPDKDFEWSVTVTTVVFNPTDNQILATAGNDGVVKLWYLDKDKLNWDQQEAEVKSISLKKHQENKKPGEKITVRSLAFSPDGKILASGSEDKTIRLWDISKLDWEGKQKPKSIFIKDYHSQYSHSHWIGSVAFNQDSDGNLQLASAGYEGTIKLWNLGNPSELDWQKGEISCKPISLREHEQSVTSVAFIPNNPNNPNSPYKLVSGSYDNTVRLWITSTDKLADMVKEKVLRSLTENERKRFEIPKRDEQQTCDR